jgi:predicted phage tail protein
LPVFLSDRRKAILWSHLAGTLGIAASYFCAAIFSSVFDGHPWWQIRANLGVGMIPAMFAAMMAGRCDRDIEYQSMFKTRE